MAKDLAMIKRLKISQAQQYMMLAVLGASIFLGVAISLVSTFVRQISFNAKAIAAEEESIRNYSDAIKNIGICKAPSGTTYSNSELENCVPDSTEASEVQGSLRANILENLAANEALNSVPKENNTSCINNETGKKYTYKELSKIYSDARGSEELNAASQLIRSCSALRVIPDALPAFKNEEALLASLNQLFNISDWEPESISPTGTVTASEDIPGLNTILVSLSIEADSGTTMNVLSNIERSIREFNFSNAVIEWSGANTLQVQARAAAYYMDESTITESSKTITEGS